MLELAKLTESKSRIIWAGLGIAGVVYLFCELAFNASLIDAVAAQNPAGLEYTARLLAGSGFGLALLRLRPSNSIFWIIGLFLCGLAAGYILQKSALSAAMSTVTANEQTNAPEVLTLEKAMLGNDITLDGLNPSIRHSHPAYMTYITMLGFTAWDRPSYMTTIHNQRDHIRHQMAIAHFMRHFDSKYRSYQSLIQQAHAQYNQLRQHYKREQKQIKRRAGQYSGILQWFLTHRNRCQSDACRVRYDKQYDKRVKKAFGMKIPWQDFCKKQPPRHVYREKGGQMQKVTVAGGYDCSGVNPALIVSRLKAALNKKHKQVPKNFKAFLSTRKVQKKISKKAPYLQGLTLKADWSRAQFRNHIEKAIKSHPVKAPAPTKEQKYQAARTVLIPPIAIFFSLFFSLFNLAAYVADGIRSLTPAARWHAWAGLGIIILFIGFTAPDNGIIGGLMGFIVNWIMHYEALIYPMGQTLHVVF